MGSQREESPWHHLTPFLMSCTPEQEKIEHLQTFVNEYGETIQEQVQQLDGLKTWKESALVELTEWRKCTELLQHYGFVIPKNAGPVKTLEIVRAYLHNEKGHGAL